MRIHSFVVQTCLLPTSSKVVVHPYQDHLVSTHLKSDGKLAPLLQDALILAGNDPACGQDREKMHWYDTVLFQNMGDY
jgi:hypothetical protein